MKLVVGGAAQGKETFTKTICNGSRIIRDYHCIIREQLEAGLNPMEEAERLYRIEPEVVIVTDEVGNGVIPVDAFEREYRRAAGRTHCKLAELSDEVYRVICGIGQRIK